MRYHRSFSQTSGSGVSSYRSVRFEERFVSQFDGDTNLFFRIIMTEITKEVFVMNILNVNGVQKIYTSRFGGNKVEALKNVSFSVEQGEYVAIMGESGSGACVKIRLS